MIYITMALAVVILLNIFPIFYLVKSVLNKIKNPQSTGLVGETSFYLIVFTTGIETLASATKLLQLNIEEIGPTILLTFIIGICLLLINSITTILGSLAMVAIIVKKKKP